MKSFTGFLLGIAAGVYLDQNYALPKITTWVDYAVKQAKDMEETMRKNNK